MLAYQVPTFVDFGRVYLPAYDVEPDYLAQQRQRRRQVALAQAEAVERRRREKEQELAYRLALAQEFERRRRRDEFVREQRRREEEQRRRKIAYARRQRQLGPHALFDFLVQLQPDLLDNAASYHDEEELDGTDSDVEEYVEVPLQRPHVPSTLVPDPEEIDLAAAVTSAVDDDASDGDNASDLDDSSTMQADSDSDASTVDLDTSAERDASLAALSSLAKDFDSHRASFVSPTTLTFSASPSPADRSTRSPTPPLAFGSPNTPFLAYEEYLLSLLTKLDAIESHGDSTIKRTRKELVKQVEAELARLDASKQKAWEELSASASSSSSDEEAEDESMSSESEDDEEDEEMTEPAEAETLTLSSDSDSSLSSPEPELAPQTVKIPFLPQNDPSSRSRRRSTRPRTHQPEDEDDLSPSSPPNDADERCGRRERDRADMDDVLSDEDEDSSDSSDDEGMFVLCL
uniref:BY PROTMAP: gi/472584980/gb/EMS22555.1/ bcl-2 associated athanogene 3-like protein [Rhodosporidium toruloides NP11] gi/647400883/emb/CDR46729.1/ RHTO0S13e00716g1_1 [Rhodosporidium toruloides] n=1 Tax=Rhodotorula toruloides TaxID=5286 RepID=A0A0K3C896_RHOTO